MVIGDFNLDPFDLGLSSRPFICGVMDRKLAIRRQKDDFVFYNPMWSRLGDGSTGPPGTFYRSNDDHRDYSIHTFDQVLIRPELLRWFDHDRLVVLDDLDGKPLTTANDLPKKGCASDHLPVCIELEEAT